MTTSAETTATPPATFRSRLGNMLLDQGLVTADELQRALEAQRDTGKRLGETLIELGVISGADLGVVLAAHLSVPFFDVRGDSIDIGLARKISEDVAIRYAALPVERWGTQIVVAMANPNDLFALDDLRMILNAPLVAALADPLELAAAIGRAFQGSQVSASLGDATADYATVDNSNARLREDASDSSVVRLLNALLEQAIDDRASDVHIEPSSTQIGIRFRIDGVLHDMSQAPLSLLRPLVSRLKIVAGMDIAQSRLPQDGRFSMSSDGRSVDVRVATIPTSAGEAAAIRLLDPGRGTLDLAALGLSATELARFEPAFRSAQGGVFVTGPTGSGKTSTLYAVLRAINAQDKNLVSVEDPAECVVDGVKQMEVNLRAGLTFPVALRALLRADPDVVMIGEVRDTETARIAADAAITGHLVLATLHTMSAAAAAMRLVDMGIEPYFVAASLTCVVAQRLARDLCNDCAIPHRGGIARLRELGAPKAILDGATVRKAAGCASCRETGYKGRHAIYEIMPVSEDIGRLIIERAPTATIEAVAIERGMNTLRVAAMTRVASGQISIDELLRAVF